MMAVEGHSPKIQAWEMHTFHWSKWHKENVWRIKKLDQSKNKTESTEESKHQVEIQDSKSTMGTIITDIERSLKSR